MQSEWTRRFETAWKAPLVPDYPAIVSVSGPTYSMPYTTAQIPSALAFAQHLAAAPGTIHGGVTLTDKPDSPTELRPRPRV
jgi:hypothetical protein